MATRWPPAAAVSAEDCRIEKGATLTIDIIEKEEG
jgi:hypothetical protein